MFNQAKQRAYETGSTVVWCDGGERGLSGVIGNGYNEPLQVGDGSWMKMIGLPYPLGETRTFFMWTGSFGALSVLWLLCGGGWTAGQVLERCRMNGLWRLPNLTKALGFGEMVIAAWRNRRRTADANTSMERGDQGPLISVD